MILEDLQIAFILKTMRRRGQLPTLLRSLRTHFVTAMGTPVIMVVLPLFGLVAASGLLDNVIVNKTILVLLYIGINVPYTTIFLSLIFASSDETKSVAVGLYGMINSMRYTGDWAGMFAAVIIAFLPTFILYIFLSEKIIGGVTGGIKG